MVPVTFSDISPYIHYDIVKYLGIQDQIKQQLVNKTWRDAIKLAFRDYRTLVIGFDRAYEDHEWCHKNHCSHYKHRFPVVCFRPDFYHTERSLTAISSLMKWNLNKNFPGLTQFILNEFPYLWYDCELDNFPNNIEHLRMLDIDVCFAKILVKNKIFSKLECIEVGCIRSRENFINLIQSNPIVNIGITHCCELNLSEICKSVQNLEQFVVSYIERENTSDNDANELVEKFGKNSLSCIQLPGIRIDQLMEIKNLRMIPFEALNNKEELTRLLLKFGHQLQYLTVFRDIRYLDSWKCLELCAKNIKHLSMYDFGSDLYETIDFDFPTLRSLTCRFKVSKWDDLSKLKKMFQHLLKSPKLRACNILLDAYDFDQSKLVCLTEHETHKLKLKKNNHVIAHFFLE